MTKFRRFLRDPRGKALATVLFIGCVGVVLMLMPFGDRIGEPRKLVIIEVFAAALIMGVVELAVKLLETEMESRDVELFEVIFGENVFSHYQETLAVFPSARPSPAPKIALEPELVVAAVAANGPGLDRKIRSLAERCDLVFPNPPSKAREAGGRAKGIEYVVPVEDLQGAMALVRVFEQMSAPLRLVLDHRFSAEHEPLPEQTLIALGLGFNHVTDKVGAMCPGLFEVVFNDQDDDFSIAGRPHNFPRDGFDCALLARVIDNSSGRPIPYFICAGRAAAGTEAAGFFLAKRWKDLIPLYERHKRDPAKDSVALLLKFRINAAHRVEVEGEPHFV